MLKNSKRQELMCKADILRRITGNQKTFVYAIQGLGICAAAGLVFYNSIAASMILMPLAAVYAKLRQREEVKKQEEKLAQEFKDGIIAVSFSLNVGYSIENAFREAKKEMTILYGKDSVIAKEFGIICSRMAQNENIENVLKDFAQKSNVEDILYFAEVFGYAKRSGGDLIAIIRNTASIISDKNEVAKEIRTIISGKKMEQTVMNVVPFGIIIYLRLTSPEFIEPLYGNLMGIVVMSLCLIVYAAAFMLGRRITDIKV